MSWRSEHKARKAKKLIAKAKKIEAGMNILLNPPVSPGTYLKQNGKEGIFEDLGRLRDEIRRFARANDTLAAVIRLTSMFAAQGPVIKCEDAQNQEILRQIFDPSELEKFFTEFFKEFLISGAVASVAQWDPDCRLFTPEQVIEGSAFTVQSGDRFGDETVRVYALGAGSEDAFSNLTVTGAPDKTGRGGEEVDPADVIWCIHKDRPSDKEGYPFFAPALPALYQKESLDGALNEELNQLAKPLIVATVAGIGDDVASQESLSHISDLLVQAQMADLRELVLPAEVDVKNAFSGIQVQDLGKYYDWCTEAILRVVGMSRTLLDGSQSGPYASGALNRDVYSSFLDSLRTYAVEAFQKRIDMAIKKLNLKMMRTNENGERKAMFVDDFGNLTEDVTDRPALEEASLSFDNQVLKSGYEDLNLLQNLIHLDVPISKQTLIDATGLELNLADQIQQIQKEDGMRQALGVSTQQLPMQNNPAGSQEVNVDEVKDFEDRAPKGGR